LAKDAYRGIHERAAALLHSLARSHALVDGNKRLVLAATIAFYGMNGIRLTLTNARAYDLVIDVASGRLDDVPAVASVLRRNRAAR
jgi:death-on-curing protein